jgi:protein tyrosine/serine phosphatase
VHPPPALAKRSRSVRRRVRWGLLLLTLAMAAIGLRRPLFQGNFGIIDDGRAYRSAQPNTALEGTIQRAGIRSIVDLRGGSPGDAFYSRELQFSRGLGADFYDIPMSANRRPTRRELLRMVAVLDQARYPMLFHCKWGADRTGLMAVLYRLIKLGEEPAKAMAEFSLSYGHVPLFGPERLHEPINEYAQWLLGRNQAHDPKIFREWLEKEYQSDDAFTEWPLVAPGPRPR